MIFKKRQFSSYFIIGIIILTICNNAFAQKISQFNIAQYGAIGDGKKLNTEVIQKVIDMANEKGGGRVIIPDGRFLSGTLQLKSNVELYLEKKAVLLGSTNPFDYKKIPMPGLPKSPKTDDHPQMALLVAYNATNISISGKGLINGQGRDLALNVDSLHQNGIVVDPHYSVGANRPNEKMRPKLIGFADCKKVKLTGVSFKNSSCWGLTFELCADMILDGIKLTNRAYWNNDGMDITDCKNVKITNCYINAADDGICLKSYYPGHFNDSIYVSKCTVISGASAVKFGTASYGGFKNVSIENIKIFDTFRSAIAIESVDGGIIENIKVNHIRAKNTGNAIFIRLGHRDGVTPGVVKNIYMGDIRVEIPFQRADIKYDIRADEPGYHNPFPSSITGIPGYKVQNVVLENIRITYPGRATKGQAYFALSRIGKISEKIQNYPEFSMFGELPAWALYVRHAQGITMRNVTLKLKNDDFRPALVFDDVDGVSLNEIKLPNLNKKEIFLKDVQNVKIDNALNSKK
ncbi:glycoside hydrolase family 28 protein [Pedobacter nutrimenti]|uniref:glycoside hydrolase family 28 protein n=1 Tax=Pedobacter nutrimenti TaxID=1241337 RepID=UPI00292F30EF|nr:glycoside hydrolase family 28 protein [Pedobacter nutrimenti]